MTRRKKNRKQGHGSLEVSARLVLTLVFCAATAIIYLGLCGRCENLGRDIKQLEQERERIRIRMDTEQYKWSQLTSPRRFQEILAQHGLEMAWPDERRVVRLPASSVRPYQQDVARAFAAARSDLEQHD